jgi:hypothetical protein
MSYEVIELGARSSGPAESAASIGSSIIDCAS